MLISPVAYNFKSKDVYNTNFKSTQLNKKITAGSLKYSTSAKLDSILRAYKDIMKKLEEKTPEGICFIQEKFPNVSIKDCLIFHNCGEEQSSILIRLAESFTYQGLTHIIERQSSSSWGNKIVKNSFLIDGNDKLLKTENKNDPYNYPKDRNYYSEKEINDFCMDDRLNMLLDHLDINLLKFRIFLNKYEKDFLKPPVGKLSKDIQDKLIAIDSLTKNINNTIQNLPKKVSLEIRHKFKGYKLISGSPTHVFENLGDENLTINYHKIETSQKETLKRLSVFDNSGKLLQTYLVTSDGKIVKNLNQNFENALPRKLIFADSKELNNKNFIDTFENYLELYYKNLLAFNKHINNAINIRAQKNSKTPKGISETEQELLKKIEKNYCDIQQLIKKLNPNVAALLKKKVEDLYAPAGHKGITFENFKNNGDVHYLPVNSKKHTGIVRLTINEGNDEKVFLIKDNQYIVKNYNPKYPQVVPPTLVYLNENDEMVELKECLEFFNEKLENYKRILENPNIKVEVKNTINENQEKILSFCKEKMKVLDKSAKVSKENFDDRLKELYLELVKYFET